MINGIDVSQWQGIIDWQKIDNETDIKFAIIRSNDGLLVDMQFERNWQEAKKTLLYLGRYLAFYPNIDPVLQALKFVNQTKLSEINLPLVVDVEVPGENLENNLLVCLKKIEELANHKPIIYTGAWFWNDEIKDAEKFKEYDLWIANYLPDPINYKPLLPNGWDKWKIWQYSYKGRIIGIETDVDLNVFNGEMGEFDKYIMQTNENDGTPIELDKEIILPPDDSHTGSNYIDLELIRSWKQYGVNPTKSQLIALIDWFETELNQNQSVLIIQGKDFKVNKENIIRLIEEKLENYDLATFEMSKTKRKYIEELPKEVERTYTNQEIINAFYTVYGKEDYWTYLVNAGLMGLSNNRSSVFTEKDKLPQLVKEQLAKGK